MLLYSLNFELSSEIYDFLIFLFANQNSSNCVGFHFYSPPIPLRQMLIPQATCFQKQMTKHLQKSKENYYDLRSFV